MVKEKCPRLRVLFVLSYARMIHPRLLPVPEYHKKGFISIQIILITLLTGCSQDPDRPDADWVDAQIRFAGEKYGQMLHKLGDTVFEPKSLTQQGELVPASVHSWTAGYLTAGLWLLYDHAVSRGRDRDARIWRQMAEHRTAWLMDSRQQGFFSIGYITCMLNAFEVTGKHMYLEALCKAAEDLSSRFHEEAGMIGVWEGREGWNLPVIVDFLSNLEPLLLTGEHACSPRFREQALRFARQSLRYHVREDFSTVQVAEFDTVTGAYLGPRSYQGKSETSTWSRGQAWAIDGFSMLLRYTGDPVFRDAVKGLADYFIQHLTEDAVPCWDFIEQPSEACQRDASAASLACTGLLEMYDLTDEPACRRAAEKILLRLSSPAYRFPAEDPGGFLLMHSTGNLPHGREVDVPLVYADYYYLESLVKYRRYCMEEP